MRWSGVYHWGLVVGVACCTWCLGSLSVVYAQVGGTRPPVQRGVIKRVYEKASKDGAKAAARREAKPGTPDLSFVPSTAHMAIVVQPQLLMQSPQFARAPHELLTTLGLQEIGIDPVKLQQITLLASFEDPSTFSFAVVFQSKEKLNGAEIARHISERWFRSGGGISDKMATIGFGFVQTDLNALAFGAGPIFEDISSRRRTEVSPLFKRLQSAGSGNLISAIADIEPMRTQLKATEPWLDKIPAPFRDIRRVPQLLTAVEIHASVTRRVGWKLILDGKDKSAGLELDAIFKHAISAGNETLLAEPESDANAPLQMAQEAYLRRMFRQSLESIDIKRMDQRVMLSGEGDVGSDLTSTTVGLAVLLPAVQASREAARRATSKNQMQHIGLGMLNYHDVFKKLPSDIMSADGKPLLSWRVAILPFIEEIELYRQFKLDEPWDSKHNLSLLDQMPDVLRSPHVLDGTNKTLYLGVAGTGTVFENQKGLNLKEVTDGPGHTIAVVEADLDKAVPWTQPIDLAIDLEAPTADLGRLRSDVFMAVFLDGYCRPIPTRINPQTIKHLFTIKGGESLPLFIQ